MLVDAVTTSLQVLRTSSFKGGNITGRSVLKFPYRGACGHRPKPMRLRSGKTREAQLYQGPKARYGASKNGKYRRLIGPQMCGTREM